MSDTVSETDIGALSQLLTLSLPHHPISERRLRNGFFRHDGFDVRLARAERRSDGMIIAIVAAVNLPVIEGRKRAQLLLVATHPEWRRKGFAGRLYAEVETELRRCGVQDIIVDSGVINSGLDLRYSAAVTMLMRRLYVPTLVGYDQTLDPEQPIPVVPPPDGFMVREMTVDDVSKLEAFCEREFPDWKRNSKLIGAGPGCGVIGAFDQATGELAAFAGYAEYIFGATGTAQKYRRRGLGTAVFWPAVRALKAAMPKVPLLIGRANIGFYARAFGCHIRGVIWVMRKDLTFDQAISKGK